ncbi:hypothetical protein [Azospirillum sp.]|uniref:hypothetical protein n=1 Tax=Azospirillum sp. TaxID=34012 RepID=UPI002D412C98|nr:hypothetical protein [Azospirillum sp.]HYD65033.1 hypothetical protein [Azospirillum sp.]
MANPSTLRSGSLWPAGLLLAASLAAVVALRLAPPDAAGIVAAYFPPTLDTGDAVRRIAAADGRLVTAGGVSGMWLVQSDESGLPERLYRAGAWFVFDAEGASGCLGNGRRIPNTGERPS